MVIADPHGLVLAPKRRAERALAERLRSMTLADLDADARVESVSDVLVSTIDPAAALAALADLAQGSGGELTSDGRHRPKFHSAYSSSAFAVNVFAPWRLDPTGLTLGEHGGFSTLRFEGKCPIFASRATPPNLDVLLRGDGATVGVESKLTEYLSCRHTAKFAPRYTAAVTELLDTAWAVGYELLVAEPDRYRHLDAAQLVKHALGLRRCHAEDDLTLLYLYWEPTNAAEVGVFAEHRREIEDFATVTQGSRLRFEAMSYGQLWRGWASTGDEPIARHVASLRARYGVSI